MAEPPADGVTRILLDYVREAGFVFSTIDHVMTGGGVELVAWRDTGAAVRPAGAETWTGRGETKYEAAVALCLAVGIEVE